MENPQKSPNPSSTITLQHPTLQLELVLPRGSLADLLMTLGYTEVVQEGHDLTPLTTFVKEDSNGNTD